MEKIKIRVDEIEPLDIYVYDGIKKFKFCVKPNRVVGSNMEVCYRYNLVDGTIFLAPEEAEIEVLRKKK